MQHLIGLAVNPHHGLVNGYHAGLFLAAFQEALG